jgi:hypothetical protein
MRGLALIFVTFAAVGLPSTILAHGGGSPAPSVPAPEALKLPDSAFPSGSPLISHTVDAAYADG